MNLRSYYPRDWPYLRDPKRKAYTILGITLVALIIFGAFAIRPSISTVLKLRKEVSDLRKTDELLDKKIDDLSVGQRNYKKVKKDLYLLDLSLREDESQALIIEALSNYSQRARIQIVNMSFNPGSQRTHPLIRSTTKIEIKGTYQNIRTFLTLLENSLYQISVKEITLELQGLSLESSLRGTATLETYYWEGTDR